MIEISRVSNYSDRLRKYKIIVDDKEISDLKDGEIKQLELDEGNHNIYLKIDWCRSNKVDFYTPKDEIIRFECGSSIIGWKRFIAFVYITFLKNQYLWLKIKD